MATLAQFSRKMKTLGAAIPGRADQIVRQIALAADRTVVRATPVDTGRARANWQASLGGPATGTVEDGFQGAKTAGTIQGPTQAAAAVISQYKGGPGAAIHITNNLPYIVPLNNGHSAQAPAGFVEKAVAAVERAAKRARLIY